MGEEKTKRSKEKETRTTSARKGANPDTSKTINVDLIKPIYR